MNAYLEILRPINALMAIITIILMAIIAGKFGWDILVACMVVFIATGAGNSINDYFDYKIDAINRPERPIPSGRISRKSAGIYSLLLFIIASILGFCLGILPGLIVLSSTFLMTYYAYKFKKEFLIGNIMISFLTALSFIFGGVVVNEISTSAYLAFFAFMVTMAREIIKDMEDMEGDRVEDARTLPILYGPRVAARIAVIFIIVASVTSPLLYVSGIFNILYIPPLLVALILFLASSYMILKDHSIETAGKVSKNIKAGMGIAFIAFVLGSDLITSLIY